MDLLSICNKNNDFSLFSLGDELSDGICLSDKEGIIIKTNNNLRDFYYRDIMLGEQDEPVYEPTNRYDIAFALKEAGDSIGA